MFIENNRNIAETYPDRLVALQATEKLGFVVSSGNVAGARRAVGVTKVFGYAHEITGKKISKNAVNYVAGAVLELYKHLGKEAPEIIARIAARQKLEAE